LKLGQLTNFCAPNANLGEGSFYGRRASRSFYTAKTHFDHGDLERRVSIPVRNLIPKAWWAEGLQQMAKGYWIAHIDVSDAEGYKSY
jgi:hypothetical protein